MILTEVSSPHSRRRTGERSPSSYGGNANRTARRGYACVEKRSKNFTFLGVMEFLLQFLTQANKFGEGFGIKFGINDKRLLLMLHSNPSSTSTSLLGYGQVIGRPEGATLA